MSLSMVFSENCIEHQTKKAYLFKLNTYHKFWVAKSLTSFEYEEGLLSIRVNFFPNFKANLLNYEGHFVDEVEPEILIDLQKKNIGYTQYQNEVSEESPLAAFYRKNKEES